MFLFTLLSFGCTKRPLDLSKQEAKISVSFQWDKLPSWDTPSDSMKLYFYGEDGNIYIKDATSDGFTGTIPPQTYNILAVNKDSKRVIYNNLDNYLTASAVSASKQSSFSHTKSDSFFWQPERVYVASISNFSIINGQKQSLILTPEEYAKKATIKFVFSGDINSVESCRAVISDLSIRFKLHNGELFTDKENLYSIIKDSLNVSNFELSAFFFGVAPNNNTSKLILNFTFTNGYNKEITIDASSAFKNVVIAVNVTVYIDVFKEAEGGFSARIKSWVVTDDNVILK